MRQKQNNNTKHGIPSRQWKMFSFRFIVLPASSAPVTIATLRLIEHILQFLHLFCHSLFINCLKHFFRFSLYFPQEFQYEEPKFFFCQFDSFRAAKNMLLYLLYAGLKQNAHCRIGKTGSDGKFEKMWDFRGI